MDENERAAFDRQLTAVPRPGKKRGHVSTGVEGLMFAMNLPTQ